MARPDAIDILPGSRIVRDGRRWRAEILAGAGRWRLTAPAVAEASNPGTAAGRALSLAWLGILEAEAGSNAPPPA